MRALTRFTATSLLVLLAACSAGAQREPERILRRVADRVIEETSFQFADTATGMLFAAPGSAPPGAILRRGKAFWGRGNGWVLLAQVELLDRLPAGHPRRNALIQLLRRHLRGVERYQHASGLWHQLLDIEDSYLESSCSAMFAYAIARSVRQGYYDPAGAAAARKGWAGVCTRIRPDGQIEGVCTGTVVSDDPEYHLTRPTPLNDIHGTGAVLLAGAAILSLP